MHVQHAMQAIPAGGFLLLHWTSSLHCCSFLLKAEKILEASNFFSLQNLKDLSQFGKLFEHYC